MEQSGRNQWQLVANGKALETAQTQGRHAFRIALRADESPSDGAVLPT
jgi:hypothetical protein